MIRAILAALLLASCAPQYGVVLLVPERVDIASERHREPVYALRHVGIDYPSREACDAVWGERCVEVLR